MSPVATPVSAWRSQSVLIALGSCVGLALHLLLRFAWTPAGGWLGQPWALWPLFAVLLVGGLPLLRVIGRRLLQREAVNAHDLGVGEGHDVGAAHMRAFADHRHLAETVARREQVEDAAVFGDLEFAFGEETEEIAGGTIVHDGFFRMNTAPG